MEAVVQGCGRNLLEDAGPTLVPGGGDLLVFVKNGPDPFNEVLVRVGLVEGDEANAVLPMKFVKPGLKVGMAARERAVDDAHGPFNRGVRLPRAGRPV